MHNLEEKIKSFAREIFKSIGEEQPSAFNRGGINGRLMQWSMDREKLKLNLFRLVDVLPSLTSSRSVAQHTAEYLKEPLAELGIPFSAFLREKPGLVMSGLTSRAVKYSVRQMAAQFIAGEDTDKAASKLLRIRKERMAFTADLLGEYAVSERESQVYLDRYLTSIDSLDKILSGRGTSSPIIENHPGERTANCVSVKLSALYSQCGPLNYDKSVDVLCERLGTIVSKAAQRNAAVYVDAEDSANNPIIYDVFKRVFGSTQFKTFPYPGIVIQAYAKSSEAVVNEMLQFSRERGNPIAVRLVKGAYWDQETILSKQQGWPSPLYADKESSDANYEKLTRLLLDNHNLALPAFASHNVRSLAHACTYAEGTGVSRENFEIQLLYGMADPIARVFRNLGFLVRFYVPLGEILPGMGYLVRRLLENTSNESFLRHTFFDREDIENLIKQPEMKE